MIAEPLFKQKSKLKICPVVIEFKSGVCLDGGQAAACSDPDAGLSEASFKQSQTSSPSILFEPNSRAKRS